MFLYGNRIFLLIYCGMAFFGACTHRIFIYCFTLTQHIYGNPGMDFCLEHLGLIKPEYFLGKP